MEVTRRKFLKISGAMAATLAIADLGFDDRKVKQRQVHLKLLN